MASSSDEDDAARSLAQAIAIMQKNVDSPPYKNLLVLEARVARMRFDQLIAAGFSDAQALTLCTQKPAL